MVVETVIDDTPLDRNELNIRRQVTDRVGEGQRQPGDSGLARDLVTLVAEPVANLGMQVLMSGRAPVPDRTHLHQRGTRNKGRDRGAQPAAEHFRLRLALTSVAQLESAIPGLELQCHDRTGCELVEAMVRLHRPHTVVMVTHYPSQASFIADGLAPHLGIPARCLHLANGASEIIAALLAG